MSIAAILAVLYRPPPDGAKNVSARDVLRVELALAEHAHHDGGGACPSRHTIAEALGIPERTVSNALDALQRQGRITRTAAAVPRRRGATYRINSVGFSPPTERTDSAGCRPPTERSDSMGNSVSYSAGNSAGWGPREPMEPDPESPRLTSPHASGARVCECREEEEGAASTVIDEANRARTERRWKNTAAEQAVVARELRNGTPRYKLVGLLTLPGWQTSRITEAALTTRLAHDGTGIRCPECGGWPSPPECPTCHRPAVHQPASLRAIDGGRAG